MRGQQFTIWLALLATPSLCAESVPKHAHLGGYPVCEASAATLIACPSDATETCLLVADNEVRQAIFAYPFDGHRVDTHNRSRLEISPFLDDEDDNELSDLEALARLTSGEVLLYGSHSRNKSCERKKKRRRYLSIRFEGGEVQQGQVALTRTPKSFGLEEAIPDDAEGVLKTVRDAIEAAEEEANEAEEDSEVDCTPQALNIEGVVVLPSGPRDEIWVGLRAPTVDDKAVLIRQVAGLEQFNFDKARLVDLGGRGIRDLTYSRGWVWGLAGPVADEPVVEFKLWRFRADALGSDGVIEVEELADVPNASEGLAIWGNTAIVLIDGGELKESDEVVIGGEEVTEVCASDAAYVTQAVPW